MSAIFATVGKTAISELLSVAENEISSAPPRLAIGLKTAPLTVSVTRDDIREVGNGTAVIQPRVLQQSVYPESGQPQGGNIVNIYGQGFNGDTVGDRGC